MLIKNIVYKNKKSLTMKYKDVNILSVVTEK